MKGVVPYLFSLWCLCCPTNALTGQTLAVVFDAPQIDQPVNRQSYSDIKHLLLSKLGLDAWGYHWEEDALRLDTSFRKEEDIRAAGYLLSIYYDIYEEYEPDLAFVEDTTGKLIGTNFVLRALTKFRYALTDLRTHQLLHIDYKYSQNVDENTPKVFSVDYKAYFKETNPKDLKKRDPKAYAGIVSKIQKDFRKQFEGHYKERRPGDFLSRLTTTIVAPILRQPQLIESPVVEKGKLQGFSCPLSKVIRYYEGMRMSVFTLDTIGPYIVPTNFFNWVVDEVGASHCRLESKFMVASKEKEAGEALAAGKALYYLPGGMTFGGVMNEEGKHVFDVRGMSKEHASSIYRILTRSPAVKVINSIDDTLINALHTIYKDERFIATGYQVAALGARYIVSVSVSDYILQDAQTGTVLASCPLRSGQDGVYDLLQENLGLKIQIIKVLESKKDVLKVALVYSPLGFTSLESFNLFVRTPEQVGTRTVMRKQEIGKGNIVNPEDWGYIFGEARFNKGEKEIYAAFNNKDDILFLTGK